MFPFAQQGIQWDGRDLDVKLGLIAGVRRVCGQLAVSIEDATGLKIPSSHYSGLFSFCACRVYVDGRYFDTPRVRSTMVCI